VKTSLRPGRKKGKVQSSIDEVLLERSVTFRGSQRKGKAASRFISSIWKKRKRKPDHSTLSLKKETRDLKRRKGVAFSWKDGPLPCKGLCIEKKNSELTRGVAARPSLEKKRKRSRCPRQRVKSDPPVREKRSMEEKGPPPRQEREEELRRAMGENLKKEGGKPPRFEGCEGQKKKTNQTPKKKTGWKGVADPERKAFAEKGGPRKREGQKILDLISRGVRGGRGWSDSI